MTSATWNFPKKIKDKRDLGDLALSLFAAANEKGLASDDIERPCLS